MVTDLKDLFFKGRKKAHPEADLDRIVNIIKELRTTFQLLEVHYSVALPKFTFMDNTVEWHSLPVDALEDKSFQKLDPEDADIVVVILMTRALKDKAAAHFVKELEEANKRKNKWSKWAEKIDSIEDINPSDQKDDDE